MAISPTISLSRVSGSASSLRTTVSQTGKTTNSIKNTLTSGISAKRNLWNSTKILRSRRDEYDREQNRKNLRLAPILSSRKGGARLLSQQDTSLSITDRLLGFVKYMTVGWIVGNLPTWINYGEQFIGRLGIAGNILSNYGDETLKVMTSIGDIFKSALKNLSSFDFSDKSGLMKSSIGELTGALGDLGDGLKEALDVLFAPFKELPNPKEEQPPTPPGTSPRNPSLTGGNAAFWTLVAVVSREDGDPQGQADVAQSIYNRAASGKFPGGTDIRQVILAKGQYQPTREYPKRNPSGETNPEWFQITDAESAAKATGYKVSTIKGVANHITNPSLQKNAASWVENRTDFVGKGLTPSNPSSTELRRRNPGDNLFGNFVGSGSYEYGKQSRSASSIPNFGVTQTPAPQTRVPPPPAGQRRLQKTDIFTKSLGKDVDYIEIGDLYLGRGGTHYGLDIRAPLGTYIALRVDAEWVGYSFQSGGYGHVLDVWVPSYGVQLRFAHLLNEPAKLTKIPAGTSFARVGSSGNSTGPHIHLEYDTQKGSTRGGGAGNPEAYVRLLFLTKSPNKSQFSPAPRPSTPLVPVAPQLPEDQESVAEIENNAYQLGFSEGIVQERRGQKIVIIDDRGAQIPQTIMSSNGETISIQIDESTLLNNFIRNKLLLDLNYV